MSVVHDGIPSNRPPRVALRIHESRRIVYSMELTGEVEMGRQQENEPPPYQRVDGPDSCRVIIAHSLENTISRRHLRLKVASDDAIEVINLSVSGSVYLKGQGQLEPGEQQTLSVPGILVVGEKVIRLEAVLTDEMRLATLAQPTRPPGAFASQVVKSYCDVATDEDRESYVPIELLQTMMGVFQSAASSRDFLPHAAQAVLDLVGLDSAAVLMLADGQWEVRVVRSAHGSADRQFTPSQTMLERVCRDKRTFRHVPPAAQDSPKSLVGIDSLVAAPILDTSGDVIGALYGDRQSALDRQRPSDISEFEATLVELLACGVAAGLARLEQEKAALEARALFEQFFTPELARTLEREPDLLSGTDAEVSVLFCDIRGFSRISERIGPRVTLAWMNDVLGGLSECVFNHQGVLVDYVGDELIAMWGAPDGRPDHAILACRAAVEMVKRLPGMRRHWNSILGESLDLGIGINTGTACVGNTGSQRKFKYGPLGNTVNLASRVQGATKYLNSNLLITGATAMALGEGLPIRRLCRAQVANIVEPVDLYEVAVDPTDEWFELKRQYELALDDIEKSDYQSSTKRLGHVLEKHPSDGPSLVLLTRAAHAVIQGQSGFDTIWKLPGK